MRAQLMRTLPAFLIWGALATGAQGATPTSETPVKVTFSEDIAPLVFNNCTGCHRPGEAAPFPLMNYRDVKKHARTMARAMRSRYMPPWQPDTGWGEFRDERHLSDKQIALFKRWVETGMAEGDPKKVPALPAFTEGWQLGKPDLIVKMDRSFTVPADGPDIYRSFVIPLNLKEDKWVSAVEVRAAAPRVVHHVLYFWDDTGRARQSDGKDGKPGFAGMGFRPKGRLGGWAVGATPRKLPDDLGLPLAKGADLVLQTHFHPSGKVEKEQLTVGLYFKSKRPTRTLVAVMLPPAYGLFSGIDIPPGKENFTVKSSYTLPVDVELVGAGAHAHYIGKSLKAQAELPDHTTKKLFGISDWNFAWQGQYQYKDRVRLPKGTVLRAEVVWDNSATNPRNPNQPPKRVRWGEGSNDEMGSVNFMMVAANEKDTAGLQKSIRAHMLRAYLEARKRGDKIDWKKLGIQPPRLLEKKDPISPKKTMNGVDRDIQFTDVAGNKQAPLTFTTDKAHVLLFINGDCPISNGYSPEINALVKEYAGKPVRFYAIHVDPDLTQADARKHAKEFGLQCPVLLDGKHSLVKATGVTRTPEVAVLLGDGSVAYRGRIDDTYATLGKKRVAPTQRDLRAALSAVLAGRSVTAARTEAVGCTIPDLP